MTTDTKKWNSNEKNVGLKTFSPLADSSFHIRFSFFADSVLTQLLCHFLPLSCPMVLVADWWLSYSDRCSLLPRESQNVRTQCLVSYFYELVTDTLYLSFETRKVPEKPGGIEFLAAPHTSQFTVNHCPDFFLILVINQLDAQNFVLQ